MKAATTEMLLIGNHQKNYSMTIVIYICFLGTGHKCNHGHTCRPPFKPWYWVRFSERWKYPKIHVKIRDARTWCNGWLQVLWIDMVEDNKDSAHYTSDHWRKRSHNIGIIHNWLSSTGKEHCSQKHDIFCGVDSTWMESFISRNSMAKMIFSIQNLQFAG